MRGQSTAVKGPALHAPNPGFIPAPYMVSWAIKNDPLVQSQD